MINIVIITKEMCNMIVIMFLYTAECQYLMMEPPRETKIGSKNQIVKESGVNFTAFD